MSLASHRNYLIDEIIKNSNIEVKREFLRKFKVQILQLMLQNLTERDSSAENAEYIIKSC
jgi:hypothetical protein